jgi:hypothetical protein
LPISRLVGAGDQPPDCFVLSRGKRRHQKPLGRQHRDPGPRSSRQWRIGVATIRPGNAARRLVRPQSVDGTTRTGAHHAHAADVTANGVATTDPFRSGSVPAGR